MSSFDFVGAREYVYVIAVKVLKKLDRRGQVARARYEKK